MGAWEFLDRPIAWAAMYRAHEDAVAEITRQMTKAPKKFG